MIYPTFFDERNSLNLFGLQDNFKFLSNLYLKKKLPKVLMFTGNKGSGKSTLINHFFFSIFDPSNYNKENYFISESSSFLKHFKKDLFSNIIYLRGLDFQSIKVEDIRNLKKRIFQSTILNKERFIVLDDIELFNQSSLNALLKIIEEPTENNHFFLINNKSKPILETIKSRSLEIKIILNENQRLRIIDSLKNCFNLDLVLDPNSSRLSPGNFVKFNHICNEYNITPTGSYEENLSLLLDLFKKDKDILFINLVFFITEIYFKDLNTEKNNDKILTIKSFIYDNLNSFLLYNINKKTFLNAVSMRLNNE